MKKESIPFTKPTQRRLPYSNEVAQTNVPGNLSNLKK